MIQDLTQTVLRTEHLTMHFPLYKGVIFRQKKAVVKSVDGVSLNLRFGETLGLVGESGCGKSTLGRTIMRLYEPTAGCIEVCGQDITHLKGKSLRESRSSCQMIFQDPYASLDPRMPVYDLLAEPLRTHKLCQNRQELTAKICELMTLVGLSPSYIRKYPHEFSGGQRQRIAIARALAIRPKVLVCDEPVSALDVSIQAQIINLLQELQSQLGLSYLFIAHDIGVVRHIAHRVAVMYLGKVVEIADTEALFKEPRHPYTQALLSAVPIADPQRERTRERTILKGELPSPLTPPSGCSFHTRCPQAKAACKERVPSLKKVAPNHEAACLLWE